ncbi:MAG TPA: uracil-DNA glycosylase, partial [Thiobacillus sp.]
MLSRDDVFRELGIGPVWRLRETLPASHSPLTAPGSPSYTWDQLADAVAHCTACKLSATHTQG